MDILFNSLFPSGTFLVTEQEFKVNAATPSVAMKIKEWIFRIGIGIKRFYSFVPRCSTMLSKNELKLVRSLAVRKFRKSNGLFMVEGTKSIVEFKDEHWSIRKIYSTDPGSFQSSGIEIQEVSRKELEQLSALRNPQNSLALVEIKEKGEPKPTIGENEFIIACDRIQDPGNMGTILRVADWFGIRRMFSSEDSADVYNPKVVQASMGSLARVEVYSMDLQEFLSESEINTMAAVLDGKNLFGMELPSNGVIMLGNESTGLSESLKGLAKHQYSIPGIGKAESLNVAVAAGIICSELIGRKINPRK